MEDSPESPAGRLGCLGTSHADEKLLRRNKGLAAPSAASIQRV
jgi:hypothetical protein